MNGDFNVFEPRDVGTEWGPHSRWSRDMLTLIETGFDDVLGRDNLIYWYGYRVGTE